MNTWSIRLDDTANWAVVITAVSIFVAFSQPNNHHGVIILNALLIMLFLIIEALRFRYYAWWDHRMKLIEADFFAGMFLPPFHPSSKRAEDLFDNIFRFNSPISLREAIGQRLRRNYLWLFLITAIAWLTKYWLFPTHAASLKQFIDRAKIGPIPGSIVISLSLACFAAWIIIAISTLPTATQVTAQAFAYGDEDDLPDVRTLGKHPSRKDSKTRAWAGARQLFFVWIVTKKINVVAKGILFEIGCDVTAVPSEGSTMLICPLTVSEIKVLRRIVAREDPEATIQILGKGVHLLPEE